MDRRGQREGPLVGAEVELVGAPVVRRVGRGRRPSRRQQWGKRPDNTMRDVVLQSEEVIE